MSTRYKEGQGQEFFRNGELKFDVEPERENNVLGRYFRRNGQIVTDHVKNETVMVEEER